MAKDWTYAILSKNAKAGGGPAKYIRTIKIHSFQNGVISMLPICLATNIISYKKGKQIVEFIKNKFGFVTKNEAQNAEEQLINSENNLTLKCSTCNTEAHGIDEINLLFGFAKIHTGNIIPNRICKKCQQKS